MYSDIFEHLGGGGGGSGGGRGGAATSDSDDNHKPPLVSFKAGKIQLSSFHTERGTYTCTADPSRGEVRLVCNESNQLEWQWFDRRERKTMDRKVVASATEGYFPRWNLHKISPPLPRTTHKDDRVYVLTQQNAPTKDSSSSGISSASSTASSAAEEQSSPPPPSLLSPPEYDLYWMQDADPSKDDEIVEQVNAILADPEQAVAKATGANTATAAGGTSATRGAGATTTTGGASGTTMASSSAAAAASSSSAQVDALSSILENLGMPQSSSSEASTPGGGEAMSSTAAGAATGAGAAATTRTLTLEDLQGAMAGIQQQQQQSALNNNDATIMSLTEVVTPEAITTIMQDPDACARLIELLPEEQRSQEFLEQNLRSPQVQQTLRALSSALLPDDAGHVDGFLSVLANFQLDTNTTNNNAMVMAASTNPIQAFLEAILRSVEKEKNNDNMEEEEQEEKQNEEGKQEE